MTAHDDWETRYRDGNTPWDTNHPSAQLCRVVESGEVAPCRTLEFYQLDELLTDEERRIRDTVRRFAERELLPKMSRCVSDARFPTECIGR